MSRTKSGWRSGREGLATNHVKPSIGRLKLKNVNALHLQGLYRERLDSGLSGSTVQKTHHVLHKALSQAVRWNLIPRNPADAVKAPTASSKEMRPLSALEARRLLEAARGERLEALYVLAVHTGMREGELLGLKWEDVDLERGVLRLKRALVREGGKVVLGDLKTAKSQPKRPAHPRRRGSPARPPGAPDGGDGAYRLHLPAQRARLRHGERYPHQPLEPSQPLL